MDVREKLADLIARQQDLDQRIQALCEERETLLGKCFPAGERLIKLLHRAAVATGCRSRFADADKALFRILFESAVEARPFRVTEAIPSETLSMTGCSFRPEVIEEGIAELDGEIVLTPSAVARLRQQVEEEGVFPSEDQVTLRPL